MIVFHLPRASFGIGGGSRSGGRAIFSGSDWLRECANRLDRPGDLWNGRRDLNPRPSAWKPPRRSFATVRRHLESAPPLGFFILWRFRRRSSQWAAVRQVRQADHSSGRRGWPPRVAFGADRFRPPVVSTSCRGGYAVVGGFSKDWLTVVRDESPR